MPTITLPTNEGIDSEERFIPVGAPAPMTAQEIVECRDVCVDCTVDQVAVFAVAHRQGIVQRETDAYEREAMNVLYFTADGERACERWYLGTGPEDFSAVDRAFPVETTKLAPTGRNARRFAPVTHRHPEVEH